MAASTSSVHVSRGRAERDQAAVEREHEVVVARGTREVVRGDHDGPSLVAPRVDQLPHRVLGGAVDAGEGLVEQQQLRVLRRDLGEQRALALAARQLAEPAAGEVVDGKRAHRVGDQLAVAIGHSLPPAERAPAAHRDHVAHGGREHRLDRDLLGQVGDAVGRRRRSRRPLGSASPTAVENSVLFPEPFGPSTAIDLPARDLDVDRLERDDVSVADGQVAAR